MKNQKLEKFLLSKLPQDEFRRSFEEKLKNASDDSYWGVMSEMRAIYIFDQKLEIPVIGIDVLIAKNKDVDFIGVYDGEKICVEIKGFRPVDEKIAREGGCIGSDGEKIDRALRRSAKKFSESHYNIVAIADENTIRPCLYENYLTELEGIPESYLNDHSYRKISAILILGVMFYEQHYDYKIWYNGNALKQIPKKMVRILDKYKTNCKK